MTKLLNNAVSLHNTLRQRIKDAYGLDDEDQTLADTLEGISDLNEIIAKIAREVRYEEAQAKACYELVVEMNDRKKRREQKAERLRDAIAWAMQEAGEKKIDACDATISQRIGKAPLIISEQADNHKDSRYLKVKTEYSWDTEKLRAGVESFEPVAMEIAQLGNPGFVLTIRGK